MNRKKLLAQTLKVSELTDQQKEKMFKVFAKYYDNVSFENFKYDLDKKNAVFLLLDREDLELKGFSTIVDLKFITKNRRIVRGLFSGDTIIETEYWGQTALGVAFLKYLFMQKLKRPFSPLYWFLISKGFKTYLMMANNFIEHWPRYERETPPDKKEILDGLATTLYGNHYSPEGGIISFSDEELKDSLKIGVAPITKSMLQENPRIAFFAAKNPEWERGNELCCIAPMSLLMPFRYQLKIIRRATAKSFKRAQVKILLAFGITQSK